MATAPVSPAAFDRPAPGASPPRQAAPAPAAPHRPSPLSVRLRDVLRSSGVPCAVAGLVAVQLRLALGPPGEVGPALGSGLRVALALWGGWMALQALQALARNEGAVEGERLCDADGTGEIAGRRVTRPRFTAGQIALAGMALMTAALQRAPARLAVNLIGYGVLAVAVIWAVRRRGGEVAAARAAAALAVFALVPTSVDWPAPPTMEYVRTDSAFRWPVGWLDETWVLRHELLVSHQGTTPNTLVIPLAQPYDGPGQVLATLNGEDLGPLSPAPGNVLQLRLPPRIVEGTRRLTLDLRQRPHDPALRLIAQRWWGGATLGQRASSYYDGQRWWPGTFNDEAGRRSMGVYVVRFGVDP